MLRTIRAIILILFLFSVGLSAQQKDFQFWPSLAVNLEVAPNLKLQVEEEVRFHENVSQLGRQINDLGASYRFNKFLKAGIFYRLEADWKNADDYSWRNGVYGDVALRHKLNRITAGYRLRLQSAKVDRNTEEYLFDSFRHRHKVSIEYDVKGIPLIPFVEAELFIDSRKGTEAIRSWIGLDYKVRKIHTLSLKYGIDKEVHVNDPLTAYIIALGYTLDLSLVSK